MASSRSYTSGRLGVRRRIVELAALVGASRHAAASVAPRVEALRRLQAEAAGVGHLEWTGQRVLEIGSGPLSVEGMVLARENQVIGIDQNIFPVGFDVRAWAAQLRRNGLLRTVKTLGRRALGQDRRVRHALEATLGVRQLPRLDVREMDAAAMSLPEGSVDLVTSRSVFEHLVDPAAVTREARRVLRPGGVFAISLHLYTSDSGCHDARIFAGHRSGIPPWAHLRSEHRDRVVPNAYLNQWRLAAWRAMFERELPGCVVRPTFDAAARMAESLADLREAGELREFSDEELLSEAVHVIWRKPLTMTS